jgi:hypothetical protein
MALLERELTRLLWRAGRWLAYSGGELGLRGKLLVTLVARPQFVLKFAESKARTVGSRFCTDEAAALCRGME